MKTHILFIILFSVLFNGCSALSEFEKQKSEWESQGWTYSETFGESNAQAEYISHMSSSTARSIKAFASDGKERKEKEFKQTEELFLIVTMADRTGKTHALVFKKKKDA